MTDNQMAATFVQIEKLCIEHERNGRLREANRVIALLKAWADSDPAARPAIVRFINATYQEEG